MRALIATLTVLMLFAAMLEQPGVRLPGDRRHQLRRQSHDRLTLPTAVVDDLTAIAAS